LSTLSFIVQMLRTKALFVLALTLMLSGLGAMPLVADAADAALSQPTFVAVADIVDIPETAVDKTALTLGGTVLQADATNQDIAWRVKDAGRIPL